MSARMSDEPQVSTEEERPPLFSSWRRLYVAVLIWEAVTIGLIAAATGWID
jgi:hypothetical protein